jgi:glucokinase
MSRAVGIDIGGTKTAVAAVTSDGTIVSELTLPTRSEAGFADGLERMARAVHAVVARAGWRCDELAGIGIGCAGPVDPIRGSIHNPYTLPGWENAPMVQALTERLGLPVKLENDADAALLGECCFGAGKGCDPVVMLTFGTGVGGGILAQGGVVRGRAGSIRNWGISRWLRTVRSATAVRAGVSSRWLPARRSAGTAKLSDGPMPEPSLLRRATARQRQRGWWALRWLQCARAVWTLAHTVLPQRILLGGGIMDQHYDLFAGAAEAALARATQHDPESVSLARAALGNRAGLVGAASLVL